MKSSWINPKVKKWRSKIDGAGLFASEKIKRGEVILVQAGKIVTYSEIYKAKSPLTDICFLVDKNLLICPLKTKGVIHRDGAFIMNHSCDPNCGLRGQVTFVAMRDISPNEELTYDYALTDSHIDHPNYIYQPLKCNCKSLKCRKIIRDTDWKKPKLRKKYRGYFSIYIEKMIESRKTSS